MYYTRETVKVLKNQFIIVYMNQIRISLDSYSGWSSPAYIAICQIIYSFELDLIERAHDADVLF